GTGRRSCRRTGAGAREPVSGPRSSPPADSRELPRGRALAHRPRRVSSIATRRPAVRARSRPRTTTTISAAAGRPRRAAAALAAAVVGAAAAAGGAEKTGAGSRGGARLGFGARFHHLQHPARHHAEQGPDEEDYAHSAPVQQVEELRRLR